MKEYFKWTKVCEFLNKKEINFYFKEKEVWWCHSGEQAFALIEQLRVLSSKRLIENIGLINSKRFIQLRTLIKHFL